MTSPPLASSPGKAAPTEADETTMSATAAAAAATAEAAAVVGLSENDVLLRGPLPSPRLMLLPGARVT